MKAFIYLFWIVLKRVWSHWKLELNLLLTFIVAVAIVAGIPLFTNGSIQYGLEDSLEDYWKIQGIPAGVFQFSYARQGDDFDLEDYDRATEIMEKNMEEVIGLPLNRYQASGRLENYFHRRVGNQLLFGQICFLTNYQDMIQLTQGSFPQDTDPAGGFEVVVSEECLNEFGLLVGKTYPFEYTLKADPQKGRTKNQKVTLDLKVSGVFVMKPEYAGSFEFSMQYLGNSLFLHPATWRKMEGMESFEVDGLAWHWYFDDSALEFKNLGGLYNRLLRLEGHLNQQLPGVNLSVSPKQVLKEYYHKARILKVLLFSLSLPVLGIVFYYIFLAVQLMISRQRTEISLLQSRGAGRLQICSTYLVEWLFLGLIALALAPFIGSFIAQMLGASRGFLSFVNREPIRTEINGEVFLFGGLLIMITIMSIMVPVFQAAGQSIVNYKQESSRKHKKPLWQRFPTELILIGFSVYGYYALRTQAAGGRLNDQIILEPSLFLLPVLMIIGFVLLVMRIFPLVITLVDRLTVKNSRVPLYMTLKLLSRSPEQYNPLIFLVIITLALGIYSSSTARTMDRNFIDGLQYKYGSDLILEEKWVPLEDEMRAFVDAEGAHPEITTEVLFEPPFYIHENLPGVKAAARALYFKDISPRGARSSSMSLLSLDPHEFYSTGWYREDLWEYPLEEYLNLLIQYPSGIIVSEKIAREAGLMPGDLVSLRYEESRLDFMILATVKYWPTLYSEEGPFGIANINYVQNFIPITPYSVWLKLEEGAEIQPIIDTLKEHGVYVWNFMDSRSRIVEGIRDPQRTGLYGLLSTGFLVAALITIAGFLLYTILSIKNRLLHFGVFRALGVKVKEVMGMLLLELSFTLGLALVIGTLLGDGVSKLFLPLLRMNANTSGDTPPFLVVLDWADKANIYLILGTAFIIGVICLQVIVSRLKIDQAVKMGEDL